MWDVLFKFLFSIMLKLYRICVKTVFSYTCVMHGIFFDLIHLQLSHFNVSNLLDFLCVCVRHLALVVLAIHLTLSIIFKILASYFFVLRLLDFIVTLSLLFFRVKR